MAQFSLFFPAPLIFKKGCVVVAVVLWIGLLLLSLLPGWEKPARNEEREEKEGNAPASRVMRSLLLPLPSFFFLGAKGASFSSSGPPPPSLLKGAPSLIIFCSLFLLPLLLPFPSFFYSPLFSRPAPPSPSVRSKVAPFLKRIGKLKRWRFQKDGGGEGPSAL